MRRRRLRSHDVTELVDLTEQGDGSMSIEPARPPIMLGSLANVFDPIAIGVDPSAVDVVCGARADACICSATIHHPDQPHLCGCGGMWQGEHGTDTFRVVRLPGIGLTLGELVAAYVFGGPL